MDFGEQIKEDLRFYRESKPSIAEIEKDEWAFNYWILDKLFCEDEDEIENKIIEYSDNGIDCFVWHEETKDLYLIQNKFYGESTAFSATYFDNAVEDGYTQLKEGTYKRSPELQSIFGKYGSDNDFYVYHYFYVTNNNKNDNVDITVKRFNEANSNKKRYAKIFYLDDIEEAFYGEPITPEKHIKIDLKTPRKGTRISVNNADYGLGLSLDAKYIMLPVKTLYDALNHAEREGYPIFDANIREYLGPGRGVNKGIIATLQNPVDRNNFFFYNNGITIICNKVEEKTEHELILKLEDPQIVNGCQTVSSVKQVLDGVPTATIDDDFKDAFVMAKILVIPGDDEGRQELRKNIVKFNNSQNNIDQKTFEANSDLFRRIQIELEKRGFLLLLKQSDKQKYSQEYKKPTKLKELASDLLNRFGLTEKMKKSTDFMIPLEKLLQVVLAFSGDAQQAFQKKGSLLRRDSPQFVCVTKALMSPELTTQRLLDLYLLYLRSEKEKSENQADGKVPVTWYLIEGFSKIECKGGQPNLIDSYLEDSQSISKLVQRYKVATSLYLNDYRHNNGGKEYNSMIKEKVNIERLREFLSTADMTLASL